jgi:hypothetical protein
MTDHRPSAPPPGFEQHGPIDPRGWPDPEPPQWQAHPMPPYQPPARPTPGVAYPPKPRRRWTTYAAIAVCIPVCGLALLALIALLSPSATPPVQVPAVQPTQLAPVPTQPPPIVAPAPPTVVVPMYGDGTYEVGTGEGQIAPGKYHTNGDSSSAYWARLRDTSGDMGTIIANGIERGPATITIKKTDNAVRFSGGAQWIKVG